MRRAETQTPKYVAWCNNERGTHNENKQQQKKLIGWNRVKKKYRSMTSKGEISTLNFHTLFIKISQIYPHLCPLTFTLTMSNYLLSWLSLPLVSFLTWVSDCSHFYGIWQDRWPQRKIMFFWKEKIVLSDVTVANTPITAMSVTESLSNHFVRPPFSDIAIFKLRGWRGLQSSSFIQSHSLHILKYYLCHVQKILTRFIQAHTVSRLLNTDWTFSQSHTHLHCGV